MKITSEARVGMMVITGFALFVWMMLQLGKFSFKEEAYTVDIIFQKVAGLQQKAKVFLSGVEIGEVTDVYLRSDAKVRVRLRLKGKIKIRRNARFLIASESFLGLEKHIEIVPGEPEGPYIMPGSRVKGVSPVEAREIISSIKGTMDRVKDLSGDLKGVLGDKQFITDVKETLKNISDATASVADLTKTLHQTMVANGNLNEIVDNVRDIAVNMNVASKKLAEISTDKKLDKDVREIIDSLNKTMKNVEKITETFKNEVATKKTAKDITATIENTRVLTDKMKTTLEKIKHIEYSPTVEVGYRSKDKAWQSNVYVNVKNLLPKGIILTTGVTDLTEKNKVDMQLGKTIKNVNVRGGIKEGKLSAGADIYFNKLHLEADFIDPNEKRFQLRGGLQLKPNLYLLYGRYELENNKKDTWFGIKATTK